MNATPTNLNPGNAVQGQTPSGRQGDASAAEVPFSRVLSGEIARTGRAPVDDASTVADASTAGDAAAQAAAALDLTTGLGLIAADAATRATDDTAAPPSDTLLGLAITPDVLSRAPTIPETRAGDAALRPAAAENGRPVDLLSLGAQSAGAKKEAPALPVATVQSADAAASETAALFSERLAAVRQGDPATASERIAELMSQPTTRPAAAAPSDAAPVHEAAASRLAPSVGTAAWGQALGEKLVWMASGNQQTASLTLNPPNLGPLQVVVNVSNDQATASFFSAQPEVRQALESAFPKLREMMSEAGIQLGQATVSAETPQQHNDAPERQGQRATAEFALPGEAVVDLAAGTLVPSRAGRGLVDTFA